jgi:Transglycosylase SLT domain/SPOR domain
VSNPRIDEVPAREYPGPAVMRAAQRGRTHDRKANKHFARLAMGVSILGSGMLLPSPELCADAVGSTSTETVADTTCQMIESAARSSDLPVDLFTRLFWVESRFRTNVTSPKGAQGIAQFMPDTAVKRGLTNPFDPEEAIPAAAKLLADMKQAFGNIGLATAAYNAGSARVVNWLHGGGNLPYETQAYVLTVSGQTVEAWATAGLDAARDDRRTCLEVTSALRIEEAPEPPIAAWGVQLSGNFLKAVALASFQRAQTRYAAVLGNFQPMIIGTRLRSRGARRFYRVMVPASSRTEADRVCHVIMARGGACIAVRT